MSEPAEWWRTDAHPDAKSHRKFIETEAKEAAERALAIVPVVPPRRKAANNSVTQKQLNRFLFEAGKSMAEELAKRDARIAELEARPVGLDYKGVWAPGTSYPKNAGVTNDGSIWTALIDYPTKEPGKPNSGWRLSCKKGRDGKDAK